MESGCFLCLLSVLIGLSPLSSHLMSQYSTLTAATRSNLSHGLTSPYVISWCTSFPHVQLVGQLHHQCFTALSPHYTHQHYLKSNPDQPDLQFQLAKSSSMMSKKFPSCFSKSKITSNALCHFVSTPAPMDVMSRGNHEPQCHLTA